jgi:uncharacterized protein (DUF1778 family)
MRQHICDTFIMNKKPGRPKLAKEQKKAEFINLRFSSDEAREIDTAAAQAKQMRSKWARNTLLEAARKSVTKTVDTSPEKV